MEKKKSVIMTISEFLNFRKLAFQKHVDFMCHFNKGVYHVECNETFMLELGY